MYYIYDNFKEKNMKNLFSLLLLAPIIFLTSCGSIDSTESLKSWIQKHKTFCTDADIVQGVLTFKKNNTFTLTNTGNPNKTQGYNFDKTHSGTYSVKSGKYWKNKEPYYYIKLNYNNTSWSRTGVGYLVYYNGKLVSPEEMSDNNGFDKWSIQMNVYRSEYFKCK